MAVGTPLVAGNNPGYASVLKDRGRLSLVTPQNTETFAQRLELMLYDDAVRRIWLEWAMEYVKQFSYNKVANQYEKIYKEALRVYV